MAASSTSRAAALLALALALPGVAAAQSRSGDPARTAGAERRMELFIETQRVLKDYAEALKAPEHIRTYCALQLADRIAEFRRADRDHPVFADRDAFFATEAGMAALRSRQAYVLGHQQLCLVQAMRTLEGYPPLPAPGR